MNSILLIVFVVGLSSFTWLKMNDSTRKWAPVPRVRPSSWVAYNQTPYRQMPGIGTTGPHIGKTRGLVTTGPHIGTTQELSTTGPRIGKPRGLGTIGPCAKYRQNSRGRYNRSPYPKTIQDFIAEGRQLYGRFPLDIALKEINAHMYPNPYDFGFIINPNSRTCKGTDVFMLTYVHSSPSHYRLRMVIRETWGSVTSFQNLTTRVVFLTGRTNSSKHQDLISVEADKYNDIIQGDFVDHYWNLTYKGIMGLKWIAKYCAHAHYILKIDDDVFVNIFPLLRELNEFEMNGKNTKLFLCMVWANEGPVRVSSGYNSKWYVSKKEFCDDKYGNICPGAAFVMSSDIIRPMYDVALVTPFFRLDDVYFTALLARRIGVRLKNYGHRYYFQKDLLEKFTGAKRDDHVFAHLHPEHTKQGKTVINLFYTIWNSIKAQAHDNRTINEKMLYRDLHVNRAKYRRKLGISAS